MQYFCFQEEIPRKQPSFNSLIFNSLFYPQLISNSWLYLTEEDEIVVHESLFISIGFALDLWGYLRKSRVSQGMRRFLAGIMILW